VVLTLKVEHKLQVLENKELREVFEHKTDDSRGFTLLCVLFR
jgi:hypothetical protein